MLKDTVFSKFRDYEIMLVSIYKYESKAQVNDIAADILFLIYYECIRFHRNKTSTIVVMYSFCICIRYESK